MLNFVSVIVFTATLATANAGECDETQFDLGDFNSPQCVSDLNGSFLTLVTADFDLLRTTCSDCMLMGEALQALNLDCTIDGIPVDAVLESYLSLCSSDSSVGSDSSSTDSDSSSSASSGSSGSSGSTGSSGSSGSSWSSDSGGSSASSATESKDTSSAPGWSPTPTSSNTSPFPGEAAITTSGSASIALTSTAMTFVSIVAMAV